MLGFLPTSLKRFKKCKTCYTYMYYVLCVCSIHSLAFSKLGMRILISWTFRTLWWLQIGHFAICSHFGRFTYDFLQNLNWHNLIMQWAILINLFSVFKVSRPFTWNNLNCCIMFVYFWCAIHIQNHTAPDKVLHRTKPT